MISFYDFSKEQKKVIDRRTKLIEKSITEERKRRIPPVCWLYLVEARLCFVYGIEVSTVVMIIMTFEELFRSILALEGIETHFNGKKIKIDKLNFNDLLEIAKSRSWIKKIEYDKLAKFRKYRNRFVHVKDARIEDGVYSQDEINRQHMIAEFFTPSVNFSGLSEEAIKLIPILFKVLDKNIIHIGLEFRPRK